MLVGEGGTGKKRRNKVLLFHLFLNLKVGIWQTASITFPVPKMFHKVTRPRILVEWKHFIEKTKPNLGNGQTPIKNSERHGDWCL